MAAGQTLASENMIGIPYGADGTGMPVQKFRDNMKCLKDRRNKHREDSDIKEEISEKKVSSGEYLTGFYKEDRLIPVITLVIYFGPDKWDGPICLHEMLSVTDEGILAYVPDYKINLITPEGMTDEELDLFRTSLREVLMFIKYSKDKK